jgi:hypothetical protein
MIITIHLAKSNYYLLLIVVFLNKKYYIIIKNDLSGITSILYSIAYTFIMIDQNKNFSNLNGILNKLYI